VEALLAIAAVGARPTKIELRAYPTVVARAIIRSCAGVVAAEGWGCRGFRSRRW
jgi:hypothetical protein